MSINVEAEVRRRQRNRRGRTPTEFQDALGWAGAPWGAIVDGYQKIDKTWHRIDCPEDIDLESLRFSHPTFANISAEGAADLWRDSLGELGEPSTEDRS